MAEKSDAKPKTTKKAKKEAEVVVETIPEAVAKQPEAKMDVKEVKATAKAGKRSAKAVKKAEAAEAKEARKSEPKAEKPKEAKKPPRSRIERAGKKYRDVAKLIDTGKTYTLTEAVELASKTSPVNFDATVELHMNLGVDPKQADQNIRGTVVLPSGTGKTQRVAIVSNAAEAEKLFAELDKGQIDFDVLIATPEMMPQLGKYARVLGPKGLMPNPKSGTVTKDVSKAAEEAKGGKVEYRVDSNGIIHVGFGKVSFGAQKLQSNAEALVTAVKAAKPSSLKGNYIEAAYLSTSMGPSIKVDVTSL